MKTIGLIGGMSWESTVPYYRQINETIRERLGGLHSARIILYSVDFHDIERLQHAGDWQAAGSVGRAARALKRRARFLVCARIRCTRWPSIEAAVTIPLLHIADPTADEIKQAGHNRWPARHAVHDGAGLLPRSIERASRPARHRSWPGRPRDRSPDHLR